MAVFLAPGFNCTIYGEIIEEFRTRYFMGHDEYQKTVWASVDVMHDIKNTRHNIIWKNEYDNQNHNQTKIIIIKGIHQGLQKRIKLDVLFCIQISYARYMSH